MMKKLLLIFFLFAFSFCLAQEKNLHFKKAKTNVFLKGFELPEVIDYSISLSPNYMKDDFSYFSIYDPITQQTLLYNSEMKVTNGLLSLDNLTRNIKRDSFNLHGATDFKNVVGIGVANVILQLLQK